MNPSAFGRAVWRACCKASRLGVILCLGWLAAWPVQAAYQPTATWLQRHDDLHVRADASTVLTVHTVIRIDSEAGVDRHAERRIEFSSSLETLEVLEAFTLTADGKRLVVAPEKIRTLEAFDEGGPEFSDAKVKVVIFPAVTVGAQLHLRYRSIQHTPFFPGHATWTVHYPPGVRFERARVDIRHDPGVALKVQARSVAGGQVQARAEDAPGTVRYAFTFRQDKATPPERGRVDLTDFAPAVHATTFADRAALATAYQTGARPKTEPTPAVRALAAELTAGAATERDKVRRLYNWVSRQIRYVSLEIGAGGYIPHPAQSILDHRYGDCKDHVVLLEALLRSVGIESTPALVNSGRAMRLPELTLLSPFNHVITYVPGLNLYLDSTARFAPMGTLPDEVMDKPVLLTATGQVARTPKSSPATDFTYTRAWMQVIDTGEVWGSALAVYGGSEEVDSRSAQFENLGKQAEDLARSYLSRFGETGTADIEVDDPLDLDKPWKVESTFELDPVVNIPGPSAMAIPVGLAPGRLKALSTSRPTSDRRYDSVCGSSRHREEVEIRLPPKVRLERIPADVSFSQGPLRYSATYRRTANVVQITREIVADRASSICTARDDEDWTALLRVLQRDLRGQVFVR
jgi:transglutaminase-like putative cysteine protease